MSKYKKVVVAVDENKARLLELANKSEPLTDAEIKEGFGKAIKVIDKTSLED